MSSPVFGFLAFTSGSYEGAIIRDMRLANSLHRRGFKVFVYWVMETNSALVDPGITQRCFLRGGRYLLGKPSAVMEKLARATDVFSRNRRLRFLQQHPAVLASLLENFVASMCDAAPDPGAVIRLEKLMAGDGVTHLLPTFVMACPIALAAKQRGGHPFEYLATFQGEEIFANYAQKRNRLADYYAMLRRCTTGSPWPAVAVSDDYAVRLGEEIGIDPARMRTIYPGIELPAQTAKPAFSVLTEKLPTLNPKIPMMTYLGRQDSEKGTDLLLYAARMLRSRGVEFQLVICGGSSFGWKYQEICRSIADHLRLEIFWKRRVTDEFRAALYAYSRCVVYPSIHREPFGMVAAEAMSHGTPVIVPDHGGVAEVIGKGDCAGGLTFRVWDSGDLADQMERMVKDDGLHARLAENTRRVAAKFDVEVMTDRVLEHVGIKPEIRKQQM
ncbi:MAG TPA: glycosyltransferase family 4 protein [Tepidisphaeraceae bacterium]|nr:glycosyltransferase family 4 protein [Tepidisphaeraceae bacterium]